MVFSSTINIDISRPSLEEIVNNFAEIFRELFTQFSEQVLLAFADSFMQMEAKPFSCNRCGNNRFFKWKTRHGKQTSIMTIFGLLSLSQMQIQCKNCGCKMYITRKLLEVAPRKKIPLFTIRRLGLIGALTTFRVAQKIVGMFGVTLDKMSIWRCVQKLGEEIDLSLDPNEKAIAEADGTGIPIQGIKKGHRGKELKVLVQHKNNGGVFVAGLSIGKYDGNWDNLFKPQIPVLQLFKRFLLITDGDTNILKGLKGKVDVLFQRCLWHIPYQFKWYLWNDGLKKKSELWPQLFSRLLDIVNVKGVLDPEAKECIEDVIKHKNGHLERLINECRKNDLPSAATYLENAKADMFSAISRKMQGKTTSHAERVMRTVNMRINVGKWSPRGALNAMKVRLSYYYNGFDVP